MTEECYQKRKTEEEKSIQRLKTCFIVIVISLIWAGLELILYGEVQHRIVDDIIVLFFIPFIYKAMEKPNVKGR